MRHTEYVPIIKGARQAGGFDPNDQIGTSQALSITPQVAACSKVSGKKSVLSWQT